MAEVGTLSLEPEETDEPGAATRVTIHAQVEGTLALSAAAAFPAEGQPHPVAVQPQPQPQPEQAQAPRQAEGNVFSIAPVQPAAVVAVHVDEGARLGELPGQPEPMEAAAEAKESARDRPVEVVEPGEIAMSVNVAEHV